MWHAKALDLAQQSPTFCVFGLIFGENTITMGQNSTTLARE